jgi:hypothetical protein
MSFSLKDWPLILVRLYQSMLTHRQPPAPNHIGPYGGSFVNMHKSDRRQGPGRP